MKQDHIKARLSSVMPLSTFKMNLRFDFILSVYRYTVDGLFYYDIVEMGGRGKRRARRGEESLMAMAMVSPDESLTLWRIVPST